jgi:hypothetical protein
MQPAPPQFEVPFSARRFQPGIVPYNGTLQFSENDLAHALFTTGRAPGDQARYGEASWFEWAHRVSIIPAYIRRRPYGALVRSDLVQLLDRSELVGVSYALGMALTAIFCRLELSVFQLMHIDRYAGQYQVTFGSGRKRADLIGPTMNYRWVVAEAKGRSRAAERELRTKLQAQKRSVLSVAGQPPWLAVGCVASFPAPEGGLQVDAFDPAEEDKEEESVRYDQVDLDRFLFAYYLPFLSAMDAGNPADDIDPHKVEAADFGAIGITLGLLRPIADLTREYVNRDDLSGYAEQIREILLGQSGADSEANFPDGSVVLTKWAGPMQTRDVWIER